jgi:UDP-GlcNAc:undecaprenyl-phosphate GlcNAc-1-phosphate transferase
MSHLTAVYAFLTAMGVAALLTPGSAWLASRVGAFDHPRERGLATRVTPRLGGIAILAGALVAALVWLPVDGQLRGILGGAALITAVGAVDDVVDLPAGAKLAGQIAAGLVVVLSGVTVHNFTLPFAGRVVLGDWGVPLTLLGLVAIMNVVNFSDGVDGLTAGVCTIAGAAFAVIAFDLHKSDAAVLAALTAGASLGFLAWNFPPARVMMGDCGSNLLGLLLGAVAVQGTLKTNAVIALIFPLAILAVPMLDTGFVLAKRIKHRRPVYRADASHFHHRFANIGFSQRRTIAYLYGWTLAMAGLGLALRFVPYSDHHGHFSTGWSLVLGACGLVVLAASVHVVRVLELLKFRRLRARQLRRLDPDTSEHQIDEVVQRELSGPAAPDASGPSPPGAAESSPARSAPQRVP